MAISPLDLPSSMDLRLLISTSFLLLAAVGVAAASHASLLPAEIYWHKVLPNVPMPSAIQDLLHPGRIGIDTSADSSKNARGRYGTNPLDKIKYGTNPLDNIKYGPPSHKINYGANPLDNIKYGPPSDKINYDTNPLDNIKYGPPSDKINYGTNPLDKIKYGTNPLDNIKYGPPSDKINYGTNPLDNIKYGPPSDKINYGTNPLHKINYRRYASKKTDHQFHNDSNMSLFFLEKDLQPGSTKSMLFVRNIVRSIFVPRRDADSIPFSLAKLPEILDHFSVKKDSAEAAAIETTIDVCEMPQYEGERKFCTTSLESLVESSMSALGTRDVQAVSTFVTKEGTPKQTYTVAASGMRRLPGSETVACHPLLYPYAVYYCHSITGTKAYGMTLTGKDGAKAEAVAVCHTETAGWNPEHVAFRVLGVKPGATICHILPQDNMLWTPRK